MANPDFSELYWLRIHSDQKIYLNGCAIYMATISRFIKYTVPKLARHKFLIYDSPLHCGMFRPYDRKLSSKFFEDDDNEVVTNAYPKIFGTKPKSTELNDNSSSEISSKKSSKILPFKRLKEHEKYKFFASYVLAKKLGEVESPEDFVPRGKSDSSHRDMNELLNIPIACIHFNNCRFPNGKSMLNWIKAIDFGLEQGCITSFGLSIAIFSFAKLLRLYPDRLKLLSVVGRDRLTTWFGFALEGNRLPSLRNSSIRHCIDSAGYLAKHAAFMKWNLDTLYGRLNYSLSIYIPAQLKCQECLEDDAVFNEILKPIITVEIDLDQPCSLEQATKDEVVNIVIKYFRYYAQLMEKPESLSFTYSYCSGDSNISSSGTVLAAVEICIHCTMI
uniref:Uncharacterized protein n=1 Tax=Romanomermis culicivorax TaxID=13658 RepID=A0A915IZ62_ROMCU